MIHGAGPRTQGFATAVLLDRWENVTGPFELDVQSDSVKISPQERDAPSRPLRSSLPRCEGPTFV